MNESDAPAGAQANAIRSSLPSWPALVSRPVEMTSVPALSS
jgi:hypothetical protein